MAFGPIASARVFVDKGSMQSKGFGFVSFVDPNMAQAAIRGMDGAMVGGRKLKVQIKTARNAARPY
jgi:RNA recognition motif-containing protein